MKLFALCSMKTPPLAIHKPAPQPVQRRTTDRWARFRFFCLLGPVLLNILRLHFFCRQGTQFARLGRIRKRPATPLPDDWAHWAVKKISRVVVKTPGLRRRPCYWRSQLIQDLLPRFGFATELHLGARSEDSKIATHLWVTLRGVKLDDEPAGEPGYVELAVYPSEATND
jgi:hypothetical protein